VFRFRQSSRYPYPSRWRRWLRRLAGIALLVGLALLALWLQPPDPPTGDTTTARGAFPVCSKSPAGTANCTIDGDTFVKDGVHYRLADIDAPELHPPRCLREAELGLKAQDRLSALLSMAPFDLALLPNNPKDKFGRTLALAKRNGQSIAAVLVHEGLAREKVRVRKSWCA
jgi:micrococcal nuclease